MKIRTRYAPSPTGRMHVGNLRTALYEYLIARHEDGEFILRIEDTDQERFFEGALEIIYRTMEETGLDYDEGPDKPGDCGPYVQSERVEAGIYMEYAKQLVEKGEAYYCFCTKERLESLKQEVAGKEIVVYDKHCLNLSKEEVEANLASGMPYVIRQNIPNEGTTTFVDDIYGAITVENSELDDMILIKSDGYPTYNFANVVDDHLMGITHVVRGNEYLSSTPKYIRLYDAFGWEPPVFVHLPLITDEEHHKLSKRSGHSSFEDLVEQGFLPEAIVNFIALLGWSPEGNEELFNLQQLIEAFDYKRVNKSPAVFDMVKLRWMNGEYIKNLSFDEYKKYAAPYTKQIFDKEEDGICINADGVKFSEAALDKIMDLVKTRIEIFPDIPEKIDFLNQLPEYDVAMYTHKKMKTNSENSLEVLKETLPLLEAQEDYSVDALHGLISDYIAKKEVKNGLVLWPLRTAVSGKQSTPGGAFEIMEILGKEESLRRIKVGIEMLEAVNA
ncbi:MAG: glutamate--tRNA ligase [Lachnospiraceae bacterium]|nr:glutamate--tRNA ligase [Lachnospiraceae bacterium]